MKSFFELLCNSFFAQIGDPIVYEGLEIKLTQSAQTKERLRKFGRLKKLLSMQMPLTAEVQLPKARITV